MTPTLLTSVSLSMLRFQNCQFALNRGFDAQAVVYVQYYSTDYILIRTIYKDYSKYIHTQAHAHTLTGYTQRSDNGYNSQDAFFQVQ